MAVKFFDNVRQAVASVDGGGVVTFDSAPTTWRSFSDAGAVDGDNPPYRATEGDDWEIGYLTLGDSVTTASRTVVASSNSDNPLTLTSAAIITCVPLAQDILPAKWLIGAMIPYTGDTEPNFGAFPDGAELNRADYPSWWDWISNTSGNLAASEGAKTDGQYGPGDGSTTFTIPDLASANRYIRMADGTTLACGDLQADGAPNIEGTILIRPTNTGDGRSVITASGAFSHNVPGAGSNAGFGSTGTSFEVQTVSLDASDSNAKYGAASEIRPISVAYPFVIVHGGLGA